MNDITFRKEDGTELLIEYNNKFIDKIIESTGILEPTENDIKNFLYKVFYEAINKNKKRE